MTPKKILRFDTPKTEDLPTPRKVSARCCAIALQCKGTRGFAANIPACREPPRQFVRNANRYFHRINLTTTNVEQASCSAFLTQIGSEFLPAGYFGRFARILRADVIVQQFLERNASSS